MPFVKAYADDALNPEHQTKQTSFKTMFRQSCECLRLRRERDEHLPSSLLRS